MPTDKRAHLLTLISSANRAGDAEALADAIRCAPVGILSRWERALLALLPTLNAVDCLYVEDRVERGVVSSAGFEVALWCLLWSDEAIVDAVRNVSTLPAWGTPDGRDSAEAGGVAA